MIPAPQVEAAAKPNGDRLLSEALRKYFDENGFGEDGGYARAWVDFHIGPLLLPFPNTPARKRAVPFHDLHHIVTGYRTDIAGEFEISAWEIGSGCRDFVAAWQLNLSGMALGALRWPRRTWRAFMRGRRSKNFYDCTYDAPLLATRVADARRLLEVDAPPRPAALRDVALFGTAVLVGLVIAAYTFLVFAPLGLIALPVLVHLRRAHENREVTGRG